MIKSSCSIVCRGLQNEMTFQALMLRFLPHDPNHVYIGTDGVSNRLSLRLCDTWKSNEGLCINGNSIRVHGLISTASKCMTLLSCLATLRDGYYFLVRKVWANS